jgi:polar amino acid transport system substrate-binding protein
MRLFAYFQCLSGGKMKRICLQGIITIAFLNLTCSAYAAEDVIFATGEYPPFVSRHMPGFGWASQILSEAGRRSDINPVFKFFPWIRASTMVKEGQLIGTFQWLKTTAREQDFLFSRQYLSENTNAVFYKKRLFPGGIAFQTYADLKPYKLVGILGYWYEENFKEAGINVNYVTGSASAWRFLNADRADLYLENLYVGIWEGKNTLPNWTDLMSFNLSTQLKEYGYIMYSRQHPDAERIRQRIDQALESMQKDGTFNKMWTAFQSQ